MKAGLLVIPTGGGKTFTAVKWIYDSVLPKNVKVLWLAHSFHLLDQAFDTFKENALWIGGGRQSVNIRVISSNPSHCKVHQITSTDDVLIMTTPTAISNFDVEGINNKGRPLVTEFKKYLNTLTHDRLLLVLDEAHHAPAYGARHLLLNLMKLIPRLYLLGLTATPTYTDETKRGWLLKIFKDGIIHTADKNKLQMQKILSREHYITRQTPIEIEVDDRLYNRLTREHKDLPEDIIDKLASNAKRNDFIIQEYLHHKKEYGKTIIFADRWFQCVYMKEKLSSQGVRSDAVYAHIDADPGLAEARNKRTTDENKHVLELFRKDEIDVLINVRMLTEGTDVPKTKSVFVTRDTTSQILLTQMIGRALRGEKAGGGPEKAEANIVFFSDTWKRLINWATPELGGEVKTGEPPVRGPYPLQHISIQLVENLVRQINTGVLFPTKDFISTLPVGWYEVQYAVDNSEDGNEQIETFKEYVLLYDYTANKFKKFIDLILRNLSDEWEKENLTEEWMEAHIIPIRDKYFDPVNDDIGNTLTADLIRITRHVGQNKSGPVFIPFEDRDKYDLDSLARDLIPRSALDQDVILENTFNRSGTLWKTFYRTYDRFKTAFYSALIKQIYIIRHGIPTNTPIAIAEEKIKVNRELGEEEKRQVKERYNFRCLCCGRGGKGVKLTIDHILPVKMGGEATIENSQPLCSYCNGIKNINEINFTRPASSLSAPKEIQLFSPHLTEGCIQSISRIVNFFYHCGALCKMDLHVNKMTGKFYRRWHISLYSGNNSGWLLAHKRKLLKYIHDELGQAQVKDLIIDNCD